MNFNYSLKKAALLALFPAIFFACDNKSEDPIPTPDPDPEPAIKTPVAVPDAAFESFLIRQGIDKDDEINQQFYLEDALEVTFMYIFGDELDEEITDLTGIEAFKNLKDLTLWDSSIKTIDLSNLTKLEDLAIANNPLEQIDLSANNQLKYVYLRNNKLEELDLSSNPYLEALSVSKNRLKHIDFSKNKTLERVNLTDNQLESISGLDDAPLLKRLTANVNQLTSLEIKAPNLVQLILWSNNLSELKLEDCAALEELDCASGQLSTLDLSESPALIDINISSNALTNIDLSNNLKLTNIDLVDNQLTHINLENNTKVESLKLNHNNLESLDVSNLLSLKHLRIYENLLLSCVQVSPNHSIEDVRKNDYQKLSTTPCE